MHKGTAQAEWKKKKVGPVVWARISREPLRVIGFLERGCRIPQRVPMQRYKIRGISV